MTWHKREKCIKEAKEIVSDEDVFTEDQVLLLKRMLDILEIALKDAEEYTPRY